ncbi:MAG TPA: MerR family transcriptional regulator [Caulobacteraceae bacterium]|nr:MerR family transcriptional regulator [Caulobacteraceae bacterium]
MSVPSPAAHLSPSEAAKALGVTPRALRIYEQRGLVRPLRSREGWRAYGPEALARLHQILALKRLGLKLAEIAVLISGRFAGLDAVLALQETELTRRRDETVRALALVGAARARLAAGEALSLDDLTTLTKETTMSDQAPQWARKMQPFIDRRLDEADKAAMSARAGAFDQVEVGAEWEALIAQAKTLVGTDPGSSEALELARRWRSQIRLSTGGDPAIAAKLSDVWKDSFATPEVAASLPFGPEVMAFVSQAMARLEPER